MLNEPTNTFSTEYLMSVNTRLTTDVRLKICAFISRKVNTEVMVHGKKKKKRNQYRRKEKKTKLYSPFEKVRQRNKTEDPLAHEY